MGFRLASCLLVVTLTGCGGSAPAPPPAPGSEAELVWIDNATALVSQLDDDVVMSTVGGESLSTARTVLDDDSRLIQLLMANVAFGSCGESLHNVGLPTGRLRHIAATLTLACAILQRAPPLFTKAMTDSDPRPLLAASKLSRKAGPLLREAKAELEAITTRRDTSCEPARCP
jgi:hypothetical protein